MKLAVQFGAGNIGRGFIGSLLSKSGYDVIFVDINKEILDEINKTKNYNIFVKDIECYKENVRNISGVNSLDEQISNKIYKASILTTAIGPSILGKIAPIISKVIMYRKEKNYNEHMVIIACENMVCATDILKNGIYKYLDEESKKYTDEYISFPNSSVDRIVPPVKNENILDVTVEKFYEWNVEKEKFKSTIPAIEGMNLVDNLPAYIERKLFTLNTGHAITSYLGFVKGYKTIDEAINDEKIQNIVRSAMQESGKAICKKHNFNIEDHFKYIDKIINRFKNSYLQDDIIRVSREPIRKLSKKDRLIKPFNTAFEYGFKYNNLLIGIASAFRYYNEQDTQSVDINNFIKEKGIEEAIKKFTGIENINVINQIKDNYENIKNILQ